MKLWRVGYVVLAVLTVGAMLAATSAAAMAQNAPSSSGYAENCGDTGPDNAGMSAGCGDSAWNGNGIGAATAANTAHPMGPAPVGNGNIDMYSQNCGDTGPDNGGMTSGCGDTTMNGNGLDSGAIGSAAK